MYNIARGCGYLKAGGIYNQVEVSAEAEIPWQYFLIDPPTPLDAEALGLAPQGVALIPEYDTAGNIHYNALDWVGFSHYPDVAGFIEEGIRFGFSRRLPSNTDFSKLNAESRHILAHPRALITNPEVLFAARMSPWCPTGQEAHLTPEPYAWPCLGLTWEAILHNKEYGKANGREVVVKMPSFEYKGWYPPENTPVQFALGAFLWLPIKQLIVVKDNREGKHEQALELLAKSATSLPYEVIDFEASHEAEEAIPIPNWPTHVGE